jgi:hypothetical protein
VLDVNRFLWKVNWRSFDCRMRFDEASS